MDSDARFYSIVSVGLGFLGFLFYSYRRPAVKLEWSYFEPDNPVLGVP